ncbi:MAG: methyltransferase domain-containing protein [Candidatus Calescibacterium sp.]
MSFDQNSSNHNEQNIKDDLKSVLFFKVYEEYKNLWGNEDEKYLWEQVNIWIDDDNNLDGVISFLESRFDLRGKRILDFGCGWGTDLIFCLKKGYDAFGIDISWEKAKFHTLRVQRRNYPKFWIERFILSQGENLPFKSESFDLVYSNQVIEHVKDPEKCISEIFRVLKKGGILYIRAPDYKSSFFEPHYRVLWFPFLNKRTAKIYIRLLNKPIAGLRFINFIGTKKLIKIMKRVGFSKIEDLNYELIFLDREKKFMKFFPKFNRKILRALNYIYEFLRQIKKIGNEENTIHILAQK